ncbi:MAG: hypothetical protein M3O50_17425 [Myxococcota bacterium]|nr:hypothetical protein [Myxococcota bacterium]
MSTRRVLLALLAVPALTCAPFVDFDSLTAGADAGALVDAATVLESARSDAALVDAGSDADGPCQTVGGGWYCATDGLHGYDGSSTDLVYCFSHKIISVDHCGNGCFISPSVHPDTCDQCAGKPDGSYCARAFATFASQPFFTNDLIYTCTAGHIALASACAGVGASCLEKVRGQACCSAPDAGGQCAP